MALLLARKEYAMYFQGMTEGGLHGSEHVPGS
jgi:hypothetical protein